MGNPFIHIELSAGNIAAAKKFYKSLFDWKLDDRDMGGGMTYTMLGVGKGTGGGMMQSHMEGQPPAWLPYVEVTDVNKTLEKAKAAGANVVVARQEIPGGMGAFGVFVDPQGAALGLWEASKKKAPAAPKPAKKAAKKKPAPKKKAKKGKR